MLPVPTVEGVRLATLKDLNRISLVAAAAFWYSPSFRFQRPQYNAYPADTLASFLLEYEAAIKDPLCGVLVAEDVLKEDEADHVYAALRRAYGKSPQKQRDIVGVCSLTLKLDSCYIGRFQPGNKLVGAAGCDTDTTTNTVGMHPDSLAHLATSGLGRDQCTVAVAVYSVNTRSAKVKHLTEHMRLSTLAVAPSYWRRGHASRLVKFCTQLADMDHAQLGVSATPAGRRVVERAGFEERETVRFKRLLEHELRGREDPPDAADVDLWIGVRLPRSRSPSSEASSEPNSGSESPTDSQ